MYLLEKLKDAYSETLEPIPLTVDWLIKFGFKESEAYGDCYEKEHYRHTILIDEQNGFLISTSDSYPLLLMYSNTDYVHQLQNLWFALFNEELTM